MARITAAFLLLSTFSFSWGLKVDDTMHYVVTFDDPETPNGEHLVRENEKNERNDLLKIRSKDNENYVCQLPKTVDETSASSSVYNGPSPSAILSKLYKEKLCSYRQEPYWMYELCHGRYVLQFHEERGANANPRTEYFLGNLHVDYETLGTKADQLNPQTRVINGEERAYFPVLYTQGTTCDITGKPRTTTVLYVCMENAHDQLYSISEVSSCNYEAIILTSRLCKHPAFKPAAKKEFNIVCYNTDDRDNSKPIALTQLEQEQEDTFKKEYRITHLEPYEDEFDEDTTAAIEEAKRQLRDELKDLKLSGVKHSPAPDTLANNQKIVQETVNRIFSGNECIHGGQGWWKFEFCYGRKVVQYHVEPNNDRVDILLGEFDVNVHKAWVDEDRAKRGPKRYENRVMQISQIYTHGDMCKETSAHRSVEVRMGCKMAGGSSLAVSVTLSEPYTCFYILTVESERFCESIQYADEYGLIKLEPAGEKFGFGDLPV